MFVLFLAGSAAAQTATETSAKKEAMQPNLVEAINQYKASSNTLLSMQESEINAAEVKLAELRTLVSEGLIARVDLEAEEQKLLELQAKHTTTQKQVVDSDNLLVEVKTEKELTKTQTAKVKLVSKSYGMLNPTATVIRGDNGSAWSLGSLDSVKSFFSAKFGHSLPTSAVGQSATHNRLGYDHRNAVDVALHPDSAEGKSLISYLQSQGIPFLAFRGAISGVATGPHIHIGRPSHRSNLQTPGP